MTGGFVDNHDDYQVENDVMMYASLDKNNCQVIAIHGIRTPR